MPDFMADDATGIAQRMKAIREDEVKAKTLCRDGEPHTFDWQSSVGKYVCRKCDEPKPATELA